MELDIDQQLWFPEAICILTHYHKYQFIKVKSYILELACPAEENTEERHYEKISRYESLLKDFNNACWKVHLFVIEVGAHGYAACSLSSCFSRLGFSQRAVRDIIKKVSDTALRCSFWIWLKRMDYYWSNTGKERKSSERYKQQQSM